MNGVISSTGVTRQVDKPSAQRCAADNECVPGNAITQGVTYPGYVTKFAQLGAKETVYGYTTSGRTGGLAEIEATCTASSPTAFWSGVLINFEPIDIGGGFGIGSPFKVEQ